MKTQLREFSKTTFSAQTGDRTHDGLDLQETNGVSSTGKVPTALRSSRKRERLRWRDSLAVDRFEDVHDDGRDVEGLEEVDGLGALHPDGLR